MILLLHEAVLPCYESWTTSTGPEGLGKFALSAAWIVRHTEDQRDTMAYSTVLGDMRKLLKLTLSRLCSTCLARL